MELEDGKQLLAHPDATVVIELDQPKERRLLLFEVDLAKKNRERLERRVRAYGAYVNKHAEAIKREHGVTDVAVVFVAPTH
ncbi:MAG: hypothetical protein E6G67_07485 [Actinobacteria bacterium]|nr:MAG: hypothetical protein E6G67_07485 [Actinomycetota bacterium]